MLELLAVINMLIECSNIKKSFQGIPLLKDITFKVDNHDKIAIIGVNGAGKTTILKIIAGEEEYDGGNLFSNKDLTLGYLKQQHDLDINSTVYQSALDVFKPLMVIEARLRELEAIMADNHSKQILEEYDRLMQQFNDQNGYSYPSKVTGVLKGLGFSEDEFDDPVKILSGGQRACVYCGRDDCRHRWLSCMVLLDQRARAMSGCAGQRIVVRHGGRKAMPLSVAASSFRVTFCVPVRESATRLSSGCSSRTAVRTLLFSLKAACTLSMASPRSMVTTRMPTL